VVGCDKFSRSNPRHSLSRDDPSAFAAPAQFGPFRVLHQIGVGALGPVFRTYEPERDRLVAVKAFRLDITPEQARTLADELSRAAEAGLFHPSIVEPIAAGVEGTLAYCAEEYVAAESLDVAMRHYAPAPITTVLPFITQLAGAIDFARAAGVGHGALHPRDVFVTPEEARATGFGVVEALERVGVRAPVRRPYTSPERIAGSSWATAADVFSLAAITYELLTARRPAGLGREIGTLTAGTPNAWMDSLHSVLARAMDPEPSARYSTALAFASALEAAARGVTDDATVVPPAAATIAPEAETGATVVSTRSAVAAGKGKKNRKDDSKKVAEEAEVDEELGARGSPLDEARGDPERSRRVGARAAGPGEDDILAERLDDEADHHLRLRDRADVFRRDPSLPLDDDIAAEAEADRFIADDFLIGAAGVAPAPPKNPDDDDLADTLVEARKVEDHDLRADSARSPREFLSDETIRRPRPETSPEYRSFPEGPGAPVSFGSFEPPAPAQRSSIGTVLLLIAGIAVGLLGGYAFWGRGTPPSSGTAATAATSGPSSGATAPPSGREFSEQAVAPPPAKATDSGSPGRGGSKPETPRPTDRASGTPPSPPAAPARPAPAPSTGTLVVRSTPSGAAVTLNGNWRGRTPLTVDRLPFRRYDVRVVQPGFAAGTEAVVLSADTPSRSITLQLKALQASTPAPRQAPAASPRATPRPAPAPEEPQSSTVYTGSIYVDSRPRGARVSIDGKAVGVTPLRVSDVRIGSHVVRLELPDHRLWSSTTRVTAGQEQRVTGSLERIQ
jgi:Protein kinase domain/PEGA domain